jgi:DNA invertase Pin-like site-specific DNA recombinase
MIYGYARVSSVTQSFDGQIEALRATGCTEVFAEKFTGKAATDRKQLQALLVKTQRGDVIIVTKIDRFARSTLDLLAMLKDLEARGVGFRSLGEPMIDTTSAHGELMLTLLGAFATFERRVIRERCAEGMRVPRLKADPRGARWRATAVWAGLAPSTRRDSAPLYAPEQVDVFTSYYRQRDAEPHGDDFRLPGESLVAAALRRMRGS